MKIKIKMTLLSDAIFGNGESIPGGEDISVLHDEYGFPYYKGGTLKGIFKEEMENYLAWTGASDPQAAAERLLGKSGDNKDGTGKLRFYDLRLPENVRNIILKERIEGRPLSEREILDTFTYIRAFTALDEQGIVKEHSLRYARCLKAGLIFYGEVDCRGKDRMLVKEVLTQIRWVGTMRNRGFGRVKIEECEGR